MTKNNDREQSLKPVIIYGLAGVAAVALIVGFSALVVPQPAGALPAYATQTGLACGRCHVNPAGGGARTSFGNAFLANGHKVPGGGKPAKTGAAGGGRSAVVTAPPPPPPLTYPGVTANPGSYYSPVVNPHFGYIPELGYSTAVESFVYPLRDQPYQ